MSESRIMELCQIVRETSESIHKYLQNGHLAQIYENALVNRLKKLGLEVEQQFALKVFDEDGTILGEYLTDLFIEKSLIVEVKSVKTISDLEIEATKACLRFAKIEHGMLINFGNAKLQINTYVFNT